MALPNRHNNKWNISELNSLQREYELLKMTIQEIANVHSRTVEAILYKLQSEGFIESWIDATGYQEYSKTKPYLIDLHNDLNYYFVNNLDYGEKKEEEEETFLFDHITSSINDIKSMLNKFIIKVQAKQKWVEEDSK